MKIYFGVITLCALYCIGISGTRAAVGVPLGGILLYVLISKNWKGFVFGAVSLVAIFHSFISPTSETATSMSARCALPSVPAKTPPIK